GTGLCTASLATRRFAVSAGHCFRSASLDATAQAAVLTFAYDPGLVPADDPRSIAHTPEASGSIFTLNNKALDVDNQSEIARDVAVMRLDLRVAASIATPLRPGGITVPTCASHFDGGTLVGYGGRNLREAEGGAPFETSPRATAGTA